MKHSTKQDFFVKSTTTNYGENKGLCKSHITFEYDKEKRLATQLFKTMKKYDHHVAVDHNALQTSCGLNHYRRDKIVIDRDLDEEEKQIYQNNRTAFTPKTLDYRLKEFKEKITDVYQITYSAWSYKIEKGTIQFTIYLTEHIDKKGALEITRKLNALNGDIKFTGWQCRNPFFNNGEYLTCTDGRDYAWQELIEKISKLTVGQVGPKAKKSSSLKKGGKQELELKFCKDYFRGHPNCTEEDMVKALWKEEPNIAAQTKTDIHDYLEVANRAKVQWKWCKNTYETGGIWKQKNDRAHLNRLRNIEIVRYYRAIGMKQKDIAEKLNLSLIAIKKYCVEIKKTIDSPVNFVFF